ncbi:MAG: hypothetical protein PHX18_02340 [Candidatus Gastranaerophilales bacterium]|nr:hypothetical protein [Candidatus Gastranaerophilales bacterium]
MKKIKILIIFILFMFVYTPLMLANAAVLEGGVEFNWPKLTQNDRDLEIQNLKDRLFTDKLVRTMDKNYLKEKYNDFQKDPNYPMNMYYLKTGQTNLQDRLIAGFYMKKILYAYGVIYKKNPKHCYYYNAIGNLFSVEIFDKNYNDYPVSSAQYYMNGKLGSVVYAQSEYDEFVYNDKGKFLGRWYQDKYYNNKAKVIMTRELPYKFQGN